MYVRIDDPGLLALDGEVALPTLAAEEVFPRNRLLMSIELNFFGCGMLIVGAPFGPREFPFSELPRDDIVPEPGSCLAGDTSLLAGWSAEDAGASSAGLVDDPSDL